MIIRLENSVSAKTNQVEQNPLVRRHLVRENYLFGTNSTDRETACLRAIICSSGLISVQLSIEMTTIRGGNFAYTIEDQVSIMKNYDQGHTDLST